MGEIERPSAELVAGAADGMCSAGLVVACCVDEVAVAEAEYVAVGEHLVEVAVGVGSAVETLVFGVGDGCWASVMVPDKVGTQPNTAFDVEVPGPLAGEGTAMYSERRGESGCQPSFEDAVEIENEAGGGNLADGLLDASAGQDEAGEGQGGLVMAGSPIGAGGGRSLAGWEGRYVGEDGGEPTEGPTRGRREVREAEEPERGGEEELVFGDVDVVVVVADFEGDGDTKSNAKLVGFAEPTAEDGERLFSLVIALQDTVGECPSRGVKERNSQRGNEPIDVGEADEVIFPPPFRIVGIADEP